MFDTTLPKDEYTMQQSYENQGKTQLKKGAK